jgi:hypothetical protein
LYANNISSFMIIYCNTLMYFECLNAKRKFLLSSIVKFELLIHRLSYQSCHWNLPLSDIITFGSYDLPNSGFILYKLKVSLLLFFCCCFFKHICSFVPSNFWIINPHKDFFCQCFSYNNDSYFVKENGLLEGRKYYLCIWNKIVSIRIL